MTIDQLGRKVYWIYQPPTPTVDYQIKRANPDGSGIETILTGGPSNMNEIVVDHIGGKIYWTADSQIGRCNLDGSSRQTLVTGLADPHALAFNKVFGILYWMDPGWTLLPQKVQRASSSGSGVTTIAEISGGTSFGMTIDSGADRLYFGDVGNNILARIDGSGAGYQVLIGDIWCSDVVLDSPRNKLYWTGTNLRTNPRQTGIWRANLSGADLELVIATDYANSVALLMD